MNIPKWSLVAAIFAVAINNLVWLHSTEKEAIANDISSQSALPAADCGLNSLASRRSNWSDVENLRSANASQTSTHAIVSDDITARDNVEAAANRSSPIGLESHEVDLPIEESQRFLYEHDISLNDFYAYSNEEKLNTIQSMSAQGDDLAFLKEIFEAEDDSAIRVAAVAKLTDQHSFAATNTLIEALDDPVEVVVLTALDTLVKNGDRTLVSLLEEKILTLPSGSTRDKFENSIHALRYSATMAMDEITKR